MLGARGLVGAAEIDESWRMHWPWTRPKLTLPSERGFLGLAGREPDQPLRDTFIHFRDLVSADMDWADDRKARFRRRASTVKVATLTLTAISTVVLGIQALPARATIALPMVAAVGALGALETYFNWRSRWVLMEETRYRLNRLRDEMDYYLVLTPPGELRRERFDGFFEDQQAIWSDVSRRWVQARRSVEAAQAELGPRVSGPG